MTSNGDLWANRTTLWLATGGGLGRFPIMPGTLGSLLGMFWLGALISLPNAGWSLALAIVAWPLGIPICDKAEKLLNRHDPSSVVLDEILAVPFAAFGWLAWNRPFSNPTGDHWCLLAFSQCFLGAAIVFVSFRFFDICKPWPIGIFQKRSGGFSVMFDDLMAAGFTSLVTYPVFWLLYR